MGNTVLVWSTGGRTYAVGAYGTSAARELEIALANGIGFVPPMAPT
jgi:hypothetical protein